jgi:hypothetical protein
MIDCENGAEREPRGRLNTREFFKASDDTIERVVDGTNRFREDSKLGSLVARRDTRREGIGIGDRRLHDNNDRNRSEVGPAVRLDGLCHRPGNSSPDRDLGGQIRLAPGQGVLYETPWSKRI